MWAILSNFRIDSQENGDCSGKSAREIILVLDSALLRYCRRLLRVPWTARRSNQSILKEISPEYSLEGLTLKLQYFSHLMRRTDSLEKSLMLGKTEGRRREMTKDEMVG